MEALQQPSKFFISLQCEYLTDIFEFCSGSPTSLEGYSDDYGRAANGNVTDNSPCSHGNFGPLGQGCQGGIFGGGGGGGYYGGGGAPHTGGGGGGSSYSLYEIAGLHDGFNEGHGYARLAWDWVGPSEAPSAAPTAEPTADPTARPTAPTAVPSFVPTAPTAHPTAMPSTGVSPLDLVYTGAVQSFTVPVGVTSITVTLHGAAGGKGYAEVATGGKGGIITSVVPVIPGELLQVFVGGTPFAPRTGGYNGGGSSAGQHGGGGGASDIRKAPFSLTDRVLVAGGGGGAGWWIVGGDGGINATK